MKSKGAAQQPAKEEWAAPSNMGAMTELVFMARGLHSVMNLQHSVTRLQHKNAWSFGP